MPLLTPSRFSLACGLLNTAVLALGALGSAHAQIETPHAEAKAGQPAATQEPLKLTPDQRLDAIRRALVKATLQGATKVETLSWIDEAGTLRDSASFRSDMRVRGVQVLAYGQNEEGEPEAKLDLPAEGVKQEDLVKAKPAAVAWDACPKPVPGLRQVVGVDVVFNGPWQPADLGVAKTLANWTLRELSLAEPLWVLVQRPAAPKNSYEAALLSSPLDQAPWRARLVLTPLSSGKVSLPAPESPDKPAASNLPYLETVGRMGADTLEYPTLQVSWQWQMARNAGSAPLMQESGVVEVVLRKNNWEPAEVEPTTQVALKKMLSNWLLKSQKALACEWMEAQVTRIQGPEINLNQGSLAGVKVGDQWLVADLPKVVLHALEPDALAKTALAEVRQVFPYSARLQVVAGQAKGVEPHWKAWPAQSLTEAEGQLVRQSAMQAPLKSATPH